MAYIGRQLVNGNYLKLDDISSQFNGSTTRFNLTSGGSPFYAGSSYALRVAIGGVIQEPESAYTIDVNQIVFASAPAAAAEFYCIVLGTAVGINVPGEATVTGSKFAKPFNYDDGLLYLDDTNNRVGINTESPQSDLHVVGVVSATSFYGDGSNLEGITSAGLGTAVEIGSLYGGEQIYYTNTVLGIGGTVTVDPPSTTNVAYTQYVDIAVNEGADLIIGDGDDLIPDILGIGTEGITPLPGNGGRVRADNFTNKAGTGAPTFPNGVNVTGYTTTTSLRVTGGLNLPDESNVGSSGFAAEVFAVENIGIVSTTTTLTSPSVNDSVMYTKHPIVSIDEGISLIIDEGDAFVLDALQLL